MTTPSQVILTTANAFGVDPELLISSSQTPEALASRRVAAYLLVTRLGLTTFKAGIELGGRDYGVILSAVKRVKQQRLTNLAINSLINSLETQLDLMERMEGLSVYDVLAIANNAAGSNRGAMALSVHEIMALGNTLQEVWQIAKAAGVLAQHIKTAANPKAIFELARSITDQLSFIAEIKSETEKEETDA